MNKIVGIKLREYGKIYNYDSGHFVLKKGDKVVVNTEQGQALGIVCNEPKRPDENLPEKQLRKVFRLATMKDVVRFEKKCELENEVYNFCSNRIKERSLPMRLVSVDRLFDGSKIMIYFCADGRVDFRELVKDLVQKFHTADGRVDFRELVKDLVQKFHTRIEMRQIKVRDQAKMVGGLGTCGRQLCCSSFLKNFEPVSIRMAKDQNLSLNPSKISGMCGRLMCCLTYEYKYYENLKKGVPKIGSKTRTSRGEGKVMRQNLVRGTLTVMLESGEEIEISCSDIIKEKP
jgi:cell fate regulator YaaT (PSP1 superfamily)